MQSIVNNQIAGSNGRPILLDAFYLENAEAKDIVIFSHGFKGFKDWGHFNALAKRFASDGLIFIKFNFSFNGTSPGQPETFVDLEAFGNNNYIIELEDLQLVINWALKCDELKTQRSGKVFLMGHSRGGGISILKAGEDRRINKLVTWASVSDFLNRNKKKTIDTWKKDGVVYAENARTHQKMPLYFQFYESLMANKDRLNIHAALKKLQIPVLIVHGTGDEAVKVEEAEQIRRSISHAQLLLVEGATHTFNVKHPFEEGPFPGNAELVIFKTIEFFKT